MREHTCFDERDKCISDGDICKSCKRPMCVWVYDDEGLCEQCY